MNKTIPNILVNCKRFFLVIAAILLVLLTSCPVKIAIKNFAGIPIKTEQGATKGNSNFSAGTFEKCSETEIAKSQSGQHSSNSQDLLPVAILTAAFLFLFGVRSIRKENKHPLYNSSGKIRSSIPLFLEYRKLIIHYSH